MITLIKNLLRKVQGARLTVDERINVSLELAAYLQGLANKLESHAEHKIQQELARMMQDPKGKASSIALVDQCFRSNDPVRVADQLVYHLKQFGIPRYLSVTKKWQMRLFCLFGSLIPHLLVPMVKRMLRRETKRIILSGESNHLLHYLRQRKEEGVQINLNRLGEAILGEEESARRVKLYVQDLGTKEVEHISIKASTLYSQINLLAWEHTAEKLGEKLEKLYRAAQSGKFINLDMEEYRDLQLTAALFQRTLDKPEFFNLSAGIALQSYLPDSYLIQKKLTEWATERVAKGGAPIRIRIVKGANLGMEQIDASIHGWPQAPFLTKAETDTNFKKMLNFGLDLERSRSVHIGVGSHNLFDISYALVLASERQIPQDRFCIEMLEGMAPHVSRAIWVIGKKLLLYTPIVQETEFENAIAYLIRRLDENTAEENFLRYSFGLVEGSAEWKKQAILFQEAVKKDANVSEKPRREQNRLLSQKQVENKVFSNELDTDWTREPNREWAEKILKEWQYKTVDCIPLVIGGEKLQTARKGVGKDPSTGREFYSYALAQLPQLESAIVHAQEAQKNWAQLTPEVHSELLAAVAHQMRLHRDALIGAICADSGKAIIEADVEVSEAIDFLEYYRHSLLSFHQLQGIKWQAKGVVLVTPPWNFPCSIPTGAIVAALAAGNAVLFKPAPEAVLVGWTLVKLFWQAGISQTVLQFINCEDEPEGSSLIKDARINCVLLTGASATAKKMLTLRPKLDLIAETGGKNSMIITAMADRDLAIGDLVQSAFGYAGQKCSACSLAILEAELYDDPKFRAQLIDAANSWIVGSAWDPASKVTPLIREPNEALQRGLTCLEEGEEWLLQPKQDKQNPLLWSSGIKFGVKQGSFTHQTELFGPVLGIMRAENLYHAIELANDSPYGLTAGLHSLDTREQKQWIATIQAGNLYINRTITGAIVQRQPFGGWKESSFGPGAKAGGPNYVQQLMHPTEIAFPYSEVAQKEERLSSFLSLSEVLTEEEKVIFKASVSNYLFYWDNYFSQKHDPSQILGQDNLFFYRSLPQLEVRFQNENTLLDLLRIVAASMICGTPLVVSQEKVNWNNELPNITFREETEQAFALRISHQKIRRVRFLSSPSQLLSEQLSAYSCYVQIAPVVSHGRIELLRYLREISLSINTHRYGLKIPLPL